MMLLMEKCVGWIPEKSARQNRTDLEKSCNLKSFFGTLLTAGS